MSTDCRCVQDGSPLASFREDDLYCPQCGRPVAWLRSPNELPNPVGDRIKVPGKPFWVYAEETGGDGNRFTFPLEFHALDENRIERPRRLVLDQSLCRIEPHDWPYRFHLEIVEGHEQHKLNIRLRPDQALIEEYGEADWWTQVGLMPDGGVSCTLTLVGNCGKQTFGLLVCGEPRYEIEVSENGQVLQDNPPDDAPDSVRQAWAVSRRGVHELIVSIACVKGFVHLPELEIDGEDQNPLVSTPPSAKFEIKRSLPTDRILGPGHGPCKIVTSFDSTNWKQGVLQKIKVGFSPDVLTGGEVAVPLFLEPRGDVVFLPRRELAIPPMYYGEVERSQAEEVEGAFFYHLKITNRGERSLRIRLPHVEPKTLPDIDWIEVYWIVTETPIADPATIEIGQTLELGVKIDLSRVTPLNHPPRSPLRASIFVESVQDDRPPWELFVVVETVDRRPELESPLAIDFGNSNTYAVVAGEDHFFPVLGGLDPENFPTAMYLTENPDGDPARLVIGREAVEMGKNDPGGMIRYLLKRWLVADRDEWETPWPIRPLKGQPRDIRRGDLIRLYLEKIILDSEAALRRTVTRVGFSYPANFSPRARKRFDQVISDLEERRKSIHPHLAARIQIERTAPMDSSPDEASAVAIGFAHDLERYRDEIQPHLGQSRTFLVASFDFGGGSIDSALLRFGAVGTARVLRFQSQHLNFGGDEGFGGDNVTTAVCRLLFGRFTGLLSTTTPDAEFSVADGNEGRAVGTDRWNNYQHLRVLGEELKRQLCRRLPNEQALSAPAGEPMTTERLGTAITEFLNRIKLRSRTTGQFAPLADPSSVLDPFRAALGAITLREVYDHPIETGRRDDPPYTVRRRVEKSIYELREFVAQARRAKLAPDPDQEPEPESEPLFIVLAGAACRLPLVPELLDGLFAGARVIGDPSREPDARPKSKVAFGLARYLDYLSHSPHRMQGLSRAGHYTHGPIVWRGGVGDFVEWVPSCFPLTRGDWHLLEDVPLSDCLRRDRQIDVYHHAHRLELIGSFDLAKAATEPSAGKSPTLPAILDGSIPSEVLLKVDGSEDQLILKVRYGKDEDGAWREFGDWRLSPADGRGD